MADQGCIDKGVPKCPRCDSTNTKFSYYQNGKKSQPRYLCSDCQRSWTVGGSLRGVPISGDQSCIGEALECPRCESTDTKFSYYQNQNKSRPRYSCSSCQRSWTVGGILRDVPVGGGKRKRRKCPRPESSFGDQVRIANVELMCPRCHSTNTKFSYDGDQKDSQIHYSCNNCQRCWTRDVTLMAIPVGGDEKSIEEEKSTEEEKSIEEEKKMRKLSKKKREKQNVTNGDKHSKKKRKGGVPVDEGLTPRKRLKVT